MASSGTIWGSQSGTRPRLSIYWQQLNQDVSNNRTRIRLTLRLHANYRVNFSANKSGVLDGTSFTYTNGASGTGQWNLYSKDIWVNHNSDGTKSQSVSGSFNIEIGWSNGHISSLSVSGTMNLNRIARASSLSGADVRYSLQVGASNTLNVTHNVHSNDFYHLISLYDGNTWIWDTGYFRGSPATSYTLSGSTVNKMLNRMGSVTSKQFRVRLRTYTGNNGNGQIGESTRNVTAHVHTNVKPSADSISVSIWGSRRDNAIGKFVQNFTRVTSSFSGSAGYGSSVRSYKIQIMRDSDDADEQIINGSSGTTSREVRLSGTYEALGTITDSRGRTATTKTTFTVHAYEPPTISEFRVSRLASSNTVVQVDRGGTWSNLSGSNNLTVRLDKKNSTSSSWSNIETRTETGGSFSRTGQDSGNNASNSYDFRIIIEDTFGNKDESYSSVGTARALMTFFKDSGIGIGKYHERGVLDVDGQVYFLGRAIAEVKDNYGDAFRINSDLPNGHGYVSYFGNDGNRKGWVGFGSQNSDTFTVNNESGGHLELRTSGNGEVRVGGVRIIDSGTSSQGAWIKFFDGTAIAWQENVRVETYVSNREMKGTWTMPIHMLDSPRPIPIISKNEYSESNSVNNASVGAYVDPNGRTVTAYYFFPDNTPASSNYGMTCRLLVMGRWK